MMEPIQTTSELNQLETIYSQKLQDRQEVHGQTQAEKEGMGSKGGLDAMGRKSKIEAHPQSDEIVAMLINGAKNPEIVRRYSGIEKDDLDYYREYKLPDKLSKSKDLKVLAEQIETADVHQGDTYLQLVIGLQKKALDALELQNPKEDPKSWAMISREARGYVELLGKALDRIRDTPPIQVNFLVNPQWVELRTVITKALEPYPVAREAVVNAIRE